MRPLVRQAQRKSLGSIAHSWPDFSSSDWNTGPTDRCCVAASLHVPHSGPSDAARQGSKSRSAPLDACAVSQRMPPSLPTNSWTRRGAA